RDLPDGPGAAVLEDVELPVQDLRVHRVREAADQARGAGPERVARRRQDELQQVLAHVEEGALAAVARGRPRGPPEDEGGAAKRRRKLAAHVEDETERRAVSGERAEGQTAVARLAGGARGGVAIAVRIGAGVRDRIRERRRGPRRIRGVVVEEAEAPRL